MSAHVYLSTACIHNLHEKCNRVCKYGEPPEHCICPCHKNDSAERSSASFVSTGDAEKDAEIAKRFALNDERITRGECPNGDGLLVQGRDAKYPETWECPQCGFGYVGPARWLDDAQMGAVLDVPFTFDRGNCNPCRDAGLTVCRHNGALVTGSRLQEQIEASAFSTISAVHFHSELTSILAVVAEEVSAERSRNYNMRPCARCGHAYASHNEHGCCWDDPCPYRCVGFVGALPDGEVRPKFIDEAMRKELDEYEDQLTNMRVQRDVAVLEITKRDAVIEAHEQAIADLTSHQLSDESAKVAARRVTRSIAETYGTTDTEYIEIMAENVEMLILSARGKR